jgi:hypothetical protein
MSNKTVNKPLSGKGGFSIVGTGVVALLALVVLGGGAVLFMRFSNQNSPVVNVQGSTAEGGDANVTVQNSGQGNNGSVSQPSPRANTDITSTSVNQGAANAVVDLSTPRQWALKLPLYQIKDNNCTLAGFGSVSLSQNDKGALGWAGIQNFYKRIDIQGTIMPSGQVDLSMSGYDTPVVITFEGKAVTIDTGGLLITGETSAPNCPASQFELRKQG